MPISLLNKIKCDIRWPDGSIHRGYTYIYRGDDGDISSDGRKVDVVVKGHYVETNVLGDVMIAMINRSVWDSLMGLKKQVVESPPIKELG